MAVAGKAKGERDVRDRRTVRQQHLLCLLNPPLGNVAAGWLAKRRLERLAEMVRAESRFRGERCEADIFVQMRLDEVDDPSPARGAETACRRFSNSPITRDQVPSTRGGAPRAPIGGEKSMTVQFNARIVVVFSALVLLSPMSAKADQVSGYKMFEFGMSTKQAEEAAKPSGCCYSPYAIDYSGVYGGSRMLQQCFEIAGKKREIYTAFKKLPDDADFQQLVEIIVPLGEYETGFFEEVAVALEDKYGLHRAYNDRDIALFEAGTISSLVNFYASGQVSLRIQWNARVRKNFVALVYTSPKYVDQALARFILKKADSDDF